MQLFKFDKEDVIELKKSHPCGSSEFRVARGGTDVRIICLGCGRDMTIPREKLDKMIKRVVSDKI